jgi:hypothetical protein
MENTERLKKAIIDVTTNKTEIVDMTIEEQEDFLFQKNKAENAKILEQEAEAQRQAILDRLGITKDELSLVFGIPVPPPVIANPEPPVTDNESGKIYFDGFATSGPPAEIVDEES